MERNQVGFFSSHSRTSMHSWWFNFSGVKGMARLSKEAMEGYFYERSKDLSETI